MNADLRILDLVVMAASKYLAKGSNDLFDFFFGAPCTKRNPVFIRCFAIVVVPVVINLPIAIYVVIFITIFRLKRRGNLNAIYGDGARLEAEFTLKMMSHIHTNPFI